MIHLYQMGGAWGASSVSPFCIKVEAYLRMAGLPFDTRFGDPRKGPRKKIPWIDDEGTIVADSQRIVSHCESKYGGLDGRLEASARARGHALRRMLEEGTYFCLVSLRWRSDEGWRAYKPVLAAMAPPVIGALVLPMIRRQVLSQLWAQGTGRQSEEDVHAMANADFASLADALGERPFLFGDEPSSFDASAFAFLTALLTFPVPSPVQDFVRAMPRLVSYRERIQQRYFGAETRA